MKISECMVTWSYETKQARVVPWPDRDPQGSAQRLPRSEGACCAEVHRWPYLMRVMYVFRLFSTLVVRDKIDPMDAHKAFLGIDEYARHCSPDVPGVSKIETILPLDAEAEELVLHLKKWSGAR